MKTTINNKPFEFSTPLNIPQILELGGIKIIAGIAVAVNNRVVPKTEWETFTVKDNDAVVVIKATQGG